MLIWTYMKQSYSYTYVYLHIYIHIQIYIIDELTKLPILI